MIIPLNEIVLNLKKGQHTTKPIQTSLGWHIIRVEDIRPFVLPTYDVLKASIFDALLQHKRQEAIAALMARTTVVMS
ncbi:peptidyl-prolyl cis-trans isomerase [Polynucleobacter wuianus]|nr:peptidyl-prolyl cis-trans isomerase [Polynucleobacter wuianus]